MRSLYHLVLIAGLVTATTASVAYVDEDDALFAPKPTPILETPSLARELGVGLAPTRSPISENPAIKPSATPTDRTKKPTLPPTRAPQKPTTRRPTRPPHPCTLCDVGETPFDPQATILFNGNLVSCQSVYDMGDLTVKGGKDMCAFYYGLGETVCDCQKGTSPPVNKCTLCEDGSALPFPNRRVIGQLKCSTIQNGARGDVPEKCDRYQSAIGHYCGCKNPITTPKYCHLCNTNLLPFPSRVVNGKSCLEHQFTATINRTCTATKKKVASACCSS